MADADYALADEHMSKLAEIHDLVHKAQKGMAAMRGELELETDPALATVASTLSRKASALGHIRNDLQDIPGRVVEDRKARAAASEGPR